MDKKTDDVWGTWIVVANADAVVLAVYGSALMEEANKKAAEIGDDAHVETLVNFPRPSVGDVIEEMIYE